ncbi:hypothetical protein [Ferruginibacter albus]|uniref:hypothetical protein n=1 Tax=Ferruginibacter albus TaxID=2875540 RepID=UPI001CC3490A|nr:hypothetical protein [Ferruginibacter albus]UAY53577.1 hypothetical protein K9M53_07895 [Ferruginibacter albus]
MSFISIKTKQGQTSIINTKNIAYIVADAKKPNKTQVYFIGITVAKTFDLPVAEFESMLKSK